MYNLDQSPMQIIDLFDSSADAQQILLEKAELEKACTLEELISETGEMDTNMVASVESAFPGLLLDNLTLEQCMTEDGVTYALESLADIQDKAVVSISVSTILIINQLKTFLTKIKDSDIADGVGAMLSTVASQVKNLVPVGSSDYGPAYMAAYKDLMGVKPESPQVVFDFMRDLKTYRNPVLALKDYPNNEYDRMFSPVLSKTVAEKSEMYQVFKELRETQANHLVMAITNVQGELGDIIRSNDYGRLARFNDDLIPRDVHKLLNNIIASYDIHINPKVPLLEQTKTVGQQFTKALKPTEESIQNKASVVNALVHQHQKLDAAYDDILKATDILSQFDKSKADQLVELKRDLIQMKKKKSIKARAVGIRNGTHQASKIQYRRILDEIEHLWALVSLFSRMSVVFVTKHAIIVKVLTEYNLRLSQFIKISEKIQAKEEATNVKE